MLDWEEQDRFSFEDSDRFEEDSLCSWSSEPESLCNNWRGWKRPTLGSLAFFGSSKKSAEDASQVATLGQLTAQCVAAHIPFELVEQVFPPVPEQLQLQIAFWSFPDNEEDIRLYSCLANGSADEYQRGEHLYRNKAVKEPLQIGFHLSGVVCPPPSVGQSRGMYNVAVTFDRRRITNCNCTCLSLAYWCSHVVAVCLHRINMPTLVTLRAPVSESLSRLHREQLQKFAQYLISELPQQILPTAQRLLDELLSPQSTAINTVCGAPDPTAGASASDQTSWYLDEKTLHDNIKKILIKFCVPAPIVFSDVNYLSTTAPPAASEWISLLRPLRGREPEGMWNLLSIVREMFKRSDRNAVPLLEIITSECLACDQILVWWLNTKVALLHGAGGKHNGVNSNSHASQHACASLCDEIVVLWRLAALNPGLNPDERRLLLTQFKEWHLKVVDKVTKTRVASNPAPGGRNANSFRSDVDMFAGFKPAIEASFLDWEAYPIPGVTYTDGLSEVYHCPFTCFTHAAEVTQVNSSLAVLTSHHTHHHNPHLHPPPSLPPPPSLLPPPPLRRRHGNRSSLSSEGFCDEPIRDSDSQEGGASDSASSTGPTNREAALFDMACFAGVAGTSKMAAKVKVPADEGDSDISVRRASKDESLSTNSDQSDECNVYYYDPKALVTHAYDKAKQVKKEDIAGSSSVFNNLRSMDDPWDILFARAEGLHAHGHGREACLLGVTLADQLLSHPPDLCCEPAPAPPPAAAAAASTSSQTPPAPQPAQTRGKKKKLKLNSAGHQASVVATATLAKCGFLCTLLAESLNHFHLAFRVGLFGLEMPRPPASTKPLEVKLANQETELVSVLKRIPLGPGELAVIRDRAHQLKTNTLRSRGDALLPITLASFLFDSLVTARLPHRLPSDEALGLEAAVAALGLKANVCEADHPLLCEGTRRQRGDLAISLLVHYKDDAGKVARIMDKLLDREVHQLIRAPQQAYRKKGEAPCGGGGGGEPMGDKQPGQGAEFEGHRPAACNTPPTPQVTSTRNKETRFKQKRVYPSVPNQPSEAGAHFMFELAKTVLTKAGGNSSTSLFTQASTNQNHHGPHRALHVCAFQIGLYALGLHNCVSPNWLSRTYSSHVSWITGQAMEIGAPAISFLIDTWEGHLTPPEAVSIADRASRGCDPNIVQAASELALSCLPHSHALNPNEIQRAILQCKEQSDVMLERSCLTVENAAKGGGVYPEVLFQVAKYWFELYLRHCPPGVVSVGEEEPVAPHPPIAYAVPFTFLHPLPPHPHLYLAQPTFQYPPHTANQGLVPQPPHQAMQYLALNPANHHVYPQGQLTVIQGSPQGPPPRPPPQVHRQQAPAQYTQAQWRHLLSAYRVGMLALETLARRVHDDRPQAKYARNPPYGEDVKWLLRIAKTLGSQYLHQFCVSAVNSIVSPFVLHDVALESAHYLSRNNPALIMQHLRSALTPLVQKCQQMYIQCMHQKLYHLTASDYEDFVSIVRSARSAFQITPDGSQQFKEWLQSIRRSKSCKKDLWALINEALQTAPK